MDPRKGVVRTGEIKALTGLRIVAAVWVVLFHFRPLLQAAFPALSENLAPVLNCGAQGVDLFFILSGFVLTWNYLDRMGSTWSARDTVHFLWLRLARVWPVYLVTLHLAALWVIFTLHVGHVPSEEVSALTATSYLRQLVMVQLWFEPFFDGTSWDGPAWSISAEWLAYLLFAPLVLLVYRMVRVTRVSSLMALAVLISTPPIALLLISGQFYTPWSWLPRIIMQFTAGALACAAVRKLEPNRLMRHGAGLISVGLIAAVVGILYFFDAHPISGVVDSGGLVDVLFVPLVIALAVGVGSLPRLLSTRLLVYGGKISFCVYMVHELVHTAWNWAAEQFEIDLATDPRQVWLVAGLLGATVTLAMLLFHTVEEPARRWMRSMVGERPPVARIRSVEPVADPIEIEFGRVGDMFEEHRAVSAGAR